MKINWETKRNIIYQHVNDKLPLCVLARKYNVSRSNLDYLYSFYLKRGEETFQKRYIEYSDEEKTRAVQRLLDGESPRALAIELKLSGVGVLKKWKSNYLQNSNKIVTMVKGRKNRNSASLSPTLSDSEQITIDQLKKENLKLKAEVDYLKKLKALRDAESQRHGKK